MHDSVKQGFFAGKKALITGGLGFIGSGIAHALVGFGSSVTILDACLDPYGWNFANISGIKGRVDFIKGDVRSRADVAKAIEGAEIVFDCAAQVSHSISVQKPFLDIDINCTGAMNILEEARASASNPVLVYAGTRGEIGQMKYSPIDEAHPTDPVDVQGINKLAAEKYYLLYHRLYGLRASSVRINNAYGERCQVKHSDYGVVNYFIRLCLEGKDLTVYGDGSQRKDYCHVDDVVQAMLLAASEPKAYGEFFMLGTKTGVRFSDMCEMITRLAGTGSRVNYVPWESGRKAIEIWDYIASNEKIGRMLGWRQMVGIEEGLKRTIAFYRERKADYF